MRPALPKSMIMDRLSTKGGDTTGSMETTLKRPPTALFMRTYTSTYANSRPMRVERMPTTKPTFKVLVMARVKVGMARTRLKISSVTWPSL